MPPNLYRFFWKVDGEVIGISSIDFSVGKMRLIVTTMDKEPKEFEIVHADDYQIDLLTAFGGLDIIVEKYETYRLDELVGSEPNFVQTFVVQRPGSK